MNLKRFCLYLNGLNSFGSIPSQYSGLKCKVKTSTVIINPFGICIPLTTVGLMHLLVIALINLKLINIDIIFKYYS